MNSIIGIKNSPDQISNNSRKFSEKKHERIPSIDILRGFTILLMIIVNDAYTVAGAPPILQHLKPGQDGLTLADIVFPAFLFIVGLTMPFSLGRRLENDEAFIKVYLHVLTRSLILLVIGFFMVNLESIDRFNGAIEYRLWSFLMLTGVIFFRIDFPRSSFLTRCMLVFFRTAGTLLLVYLAWKYRSKGGTGLIQMRTQWWGIVGLIGWAYFVSGTLYLVFRKLPTGMLGASALLYCLYMADKAGMFRNLELIKSVVNIGPHLGTHPAICVSGAAMGMLISENIPHKVHVHRLIRALLLGAGFAAVGFMLHSLKQLHFMFKISKLGATPSWGLISSALTAWAWAVVYLVSDVPKWKIIPRIVEYAGRNALMAYILFTQAIYGISLLGTHFFKFDFYRELASSCGLWRSVCFSVAIVLFAGILEKFKIRMKL